MTPPRLLPGDSSDDGSSVALGVTGGGQLGRMFVHAAQSLGFRTLVLDPDGNSPAGLVSHRQVVAAYSDLAGLEDFAGECRAVTTEFENVPAGALRALALQCSVSPSASAVEVCQHRLTEKQFFDRAGVPCAPYAFVQSDADVLGVDPSLFPGILKTAVLGYDGKGQAAVASAAELGEVWRSLHGVPCVLEKRLPLWRELSVIVARGADDQIVHLPVQQNLHRDGILAVTQVPAPDVPEPIASAAVAHAERLARALGYVGVLCVEFFLLQDGSLVANEMAPRPHNSGHYSIDACDLSQFDLQVRTTAGLPLVVPRLHSCAVMLNLLGDLWFTEGAVPVTPDWARLLVLPGVHLHLYGKAEPRAGRKMGHVTVTAADAASARRTALQVAALLGLPAF